MAKTLDRARPASTIADMIDESLIEQATQEAETPPPVAETAPSLTVTPAPSVPGARPGERTGEHTDISKMYRLTPTAVRTTRELSRCLSRNLGFEINNSAVIRSILRVLHQAEADIHRLADEQLKPHQQPSTAIGNEHERDALESKIARIIMAGIRACAATNDKG